MSNPSTAPIRLRPTTTDYLLVGLAPALIIGMISCLVFFLITILYNGPFTIRLMYLLGLYTFASVLIGRIAIEQSRSHAMIYTLVLGIATLFVVMRFVEFNGKFAPFSLGIVAGFLVLIGFLADRITFDCTLIDEQEDTSGEGLLQSLGLLRSTMTAEDRAKQSGKKAKKRKHNPGVWVLYFALLALPLFGLGQLAIPSHDGVSRWRAFWFLFGYLACALSLLVTTSFLGLRRYLRHRQVAMPPSISAVWVGSGIVGIMLLLFAASVMPLPGRSAGLIDLNWIGSPENLQASRYGWGPEGVDKNKNPDAAKITRNDRPNAEPGKTTKDGKGENGDIRADGKRAAAGGEKGEGGGGQDPSQSKSNSSSNDPKGQSQKSSAEKSGGQDSGQSKGESQKGNGENGANIGDKSSGQSKSSDQGKSNDSKSQETGDQSSNSSDSKNSSESQQSQNQKSGQSNSSEQSKSDQKSSENKQNSSKENSSDPKSKSNSSKDSKSDKESNSKQKDSKADSKQDQRDNKQEESNSKENEKQDQSDQEQRDPNETPQQRQERERRQEQRKEQQRRDQQKQNEEDQKKEEDERQKQEKQGNQQSASETPKPPSAPSFQMPSLSGLSAIIKWLTIAILAGIVLVYLIMHGKELLEALKALFQKEGEGTAAPSDTINSPVKKPKVYRPFGSFVNPFAGSLSGWNPAEVVRHTFDAVEAWGRERNLPRQEDETPDEYLRRLSSRFQEQADHLQWLSNLYNRLAYAGGRVDTGDVQRLAKLWSWMPAV